MSLSVNRNFVSNRLPVGVESRKKFGSLPWDRSAWPLGGFEVGRRAAAGRAGRREEERAERRAGFTECEVSKGWMSAV